MVGCVAGKKQWHRGSGHICPQVSAHWILSSPCNCSVSGKTHSVDRALALQGQGHFLLHKVCAVPASAGHWGTHQLA